MDAGTELDLGPTKKRSGQNFDERLGPVAGLNLELEHSGRGGQNVEKRLGPVDRPNRQRKK